MNGISDEMQGRSGDWKVVAFEVAVDLLLLLGFLVTLYSSPIHTS